MRTLADRYTLDDRVLEGPGWSYWCGHDGVLRRSVGILAVNAGHPAETDVLAAARAAAAAEDPRIQRVLDVLTDNEGSCIVIEWIAGTSLEDLLSEGPLAEEEALRITLEVASALAVVNLQGLHHGGLTPAWILRTDDGRIRIGGLSVAGALAGRCAELIDGHGATAFGDSASDAERLGAVLYASLTGRWPVVEESGLGHPSAVAVNPADSGLPAAPMQGGRPVRARMVRAGVPHALDEVVARALGLSNRGDPLATPAAIAQALREAADRMGGVDLDHPTMLDDQVSQPGFLPGATLAARSSREQAPRRPARAIASVVVVLALLGGGLLVGRALTTRRTDVAGTSATTSPSASASSPAAPLLPLGVAAVSVLEPPGAHKPDDPTGAKYAVDGNLATAWHTLDYYSSPYLGRAKPGVGLLIDLGRLHSVGKVTIDLVGTGTTLEMWASSVKAPTYLGYVEEIDQADAGPAVTLTLPSGFRARYLLIWLVKLPAVPGQPGVFAGGIREVAVLGR